MDQKYKQKRRQINEERDKETYKRWKSLTQSLKELFSQANSHSLPRFLSQEVKQ